MTLLASIELASKRLEEPEYKPLVAAAQIRLRILQFRMYDAQMPVLALFEGWDAGGKGGVIRRVTAALDARQYRVIPIAAPTDEEKAHHYLRRFARHLPRLGRFTIFDRSWYGRVLVERVEGFAPPDEWRRAYWEINDFEEELTDHGLIVMKFWLHISKDEQLRRFQERERTPWKQYKITDEDYRNREKWPLYERAVHDMVVQTSTAYAPWYLVAANDKRHARVEVLRHVVGRLEERVDAARKAAKERKKARKDRKGK